MCMWEEVGYDLREGTPILQSRRSRGYLRDDALAGMPKA